MIVPVAFDEDPAVRAVFTSREPGNLSLLVGSGDVGAARSAALATVGAAPSDAVFMQQVHGGAVAFVTAADRGRGAVDAADAVRGVDALVTSEENVALTVLVADCVPLLLVQPGASIAAVHAGRRGVTSGIVSAAVAALPNGAAGVVAAIGPAIGGCCYEVEAELAEQVAALVPAAKATTTWGTPSLDLVAAVESQLADAGVHRVRRIGGCTRCGDGGWFSHRAAGEGRPAGRQAGVVMRTTGHAASWGASV